MQEYLNIAAILVALTAVVVPLVVSYLDSRKPLKLKITQALDGNNGQPGVHYTRYFIFQVTAINESTRPKAVQWYAGSLAGGERTGGSWYDAFDWEKITTIPPLSGETREFVIRENSLKAIRAGNKSRVATAVHVVDVLAGKDIYGTIECESLEPEAVNGDPARVKTPFIITLGMTSE